MKKIKIFAVIIVALVVCFMAVACIPNNPDKALKRLENYDYNIVDDTTSADVEKYSEVTERYGKGITRYIFAENGDHEAVIIYFETKDQAKNAVEILKKEMEMFIEKESPEVEYLVKSNNAVVFAGTDAVLKILKNIVNV